MKVYKIEIFTNNGKVLDKIKFPEGKIFKNFDEYFTKNKKYYCIRGYNKTGRIIYFQWNDKKSSRYIFNDKNQEIFIKYANGTIDYPEGKEVYARYLNKFKKEKLEKILNKKETT